ncbi:hypothetical protein [Paenibacillus alkalitolerans]|uniref:hypothetical protein n=1 Tax=Paenibacillus alkalitolerans TaxID=2799335 RepID=UPI0018F70F12|nr:hypothetical protein [Paenibacillus alkalitolerans]
MVDELLKQIIAKLDGLDRRFDAVDEKLIKIEQDQKLTLAELRGFKNEMRDFKSEVKGWQRYTDARLDSIDGTLDRMRDAIQ